MCTVFFDRFLLSHEGYSVCVYHGQVLVIIQVDTKSATYYLYQRCLSLVWIMLWVVTPRLIDSGWKIGARKFGIPSSGAILLLSLLLLVVVIDAYL